MNLILPKWLYEAEQKNVQLQNELNQYAERELKVPVRLRTTLAEAGWVDCGMEFTCIPDAAHPWDPNVLKMIWSFDPTVIPVWVRWIFRNWESGEMKEEVFGRHGIARYVDNPHGELPPFPCEMPRMPCQGVTFKQPNCLDMILMKFDSPDDRPGSYVPWDENLYGFLRQRYRNATPKEIMKTVQDKIDREAAEREKMMDELEYRGRDINKYAEKKLEQVSEVEMKEYFLGKRERKRTPSIIVPGGPTPLVTKS